MEWLKLLPLVVLLPLFPGSMVFTWLERQAARLWTKTILMLLWSQLGVTAMLWLAPPVPGWLALWAIGTAALYALRALVLNEATAWASFMFVSLLSLAWLVPFAKMDAARAHLDMLLAVAPLLLLGLLSGLMAARFGSAYLGLVEGLVHRFPRLSTMLVLAVLAVIATPPFPLFFYLVESMHSLALGLSLGLLLVWYLWGWAGVRLLQRLVLGPEGRACREVSDLSPGLLWTLVAIFLLLGLLGLSEGLALVEAS